MLIKGIVKTIIALNSNTKPQQISAGIAFAVLLALIPANNLLWFLLLIISFFLKINISVELVFLALLKLPTRLLHGFLDFTGYSVLTFEPLVDFYSFLYNIPLVSFTRFNNTVVLGGFLAGIILFIPLFFLFNFLVTLYRTKIQKRLADSKFVKAFQKLPIVAKIRKVFQKAWSFYGSIK